MKKVPTSNLVGDSKHKKKEPRIVLETQLRELIDTDRVQMVDYEFRYMKRQLERFLELRKPNKTPYDIYHAPAFPPDGIYSATTYDEAYKALGWQASSNVRNRPAFDVEFKPDADKTIRQLAEKEVEAMVVTFVNRAMDKLGPVVDVVPGLKMKKESRPNAFMQGAWVGYIGFEFESGLKFTAELKVIQNRSKHGKLFAQYPMTFYDATLPDSGGDFLTKKATSIEDIWASIGYVPPPPTPRPRWSKLVGGSVVKHDGKVVFIGTPGVAKKLGIPQYAEQIARIESNEYGCYIEHADGTKDKHKYTEAELALFSEAEGEYPNKNYSKGTEARRQFAFKKFFPEEAS